LPAARVKEAAVRRWIFRQVMSHLTEKYGNNAWHSDEFDTLWQYVRQFGPQGITLALAEFRRDVFPAAFVGTHGMGEDPVADVFEAVWDRRSDDPIDRVYASRKTLEHAARYENDDESVIVDAVVADWRAAQADEGAASEAGV